MKPYWKNAKGSQKTKGTHLRRLTWTPARPTRPMADASPVREFASDLPKTFGKKQRRENLTPRRINQLLLSIEDEGDDDDGDDDVVVRDIQQPGPSGVALGVGGECYNR